MRTKEKVQEEVLQLQLAEDKDAFYACQLEALITDETEKNQVIYCSRAYLGNEDRKETREQLAELMNAVIRVGEYAVHFLFSQDAGALLEESHPAFGLWEQFFTMKGKVSILDGPSAKAYQEKFPEVKILSSSQFAQIFLHCDVRTLC